MTSDFHPGDPGSNPGRRFAFQLASSYSYKVFALANSNAIVLQIKNKKNKRHFGRVG